MREKLTSRDIKLEFAYVMNNACKESQLLLNRTISCSEGQMKVT